MKIKFSFFFAWYDAWIGLFFDQKKRILYICPLPCCVFRFEAVEHRVQSDEKPCPLDHKELFQTGTDVCPECNEVTAFHR